MATTTSTDNTGLLDYLGPVFKNDTGIELKWVAVGTGKALTLGRNCDVDILMVHAPTAEQRFIANGHGVDRRTFMYNDFVLIGPLDDPAGIRGCSVQDAFKIINSKHVPFASRGDDSGTNKKEVFLWNDASLYPPDREPWYIQTGQGMLNTLMIAAETDAYTLADRGTYIKYAESYKGNPPLGILVERDRSLRNQYSVIAVNPQKCNRVRYDLAIEFIQWIVSHKAQQLIGEFRLLGKQLFIPNADE